jgi:hypothetical protein
LLKKCLANKVLPLPKYFRLQRQRRFPQCVKPRLFNAPAFSAVCEAVPLNKTGFSTVFAFDVAEIAFDDAHTKRK